MNTPVLRIRLASTLLAALASAPAWTFEAPPAPPPWPDPAQRAGGAARWVAQLGSDAAALAQAELAGERMVKGAPYCADATHESVQTLADGNRIVRTRQTGSCRDGSRGSSAAARDP